MNYFKFVVLLFVLIITASCEKDSLSSVTPVDSIDNSGDVERLYDEKSELKREFGRALVSSMHDSKQLRDLIKTEALKMFNKDYEVLYLHVKDVQVENGLTVEELISKNLARDVSIRQIIEEYPTLTILIPELPQNTFSAQLWDAENVIPAVAIRTNKHNDVPIIENDFTERVIAAEYIPAFPVLVVKNNERLIANTKCDATYFDNVKSRIVYAGEGLELKFWANEFDNSPESNADKRLTFQLDDLVEEAYNIYENVDGWQRDYIYYGIEPSNQNGQFSFDFKDHFTSFRLLGDPEGAYSRISDQTGDPEIRPVINSGDYNNANYWTGGFYELKFRTLINASSGVGAELINGVSVNPNDLFDLTYRRIPFSIYAIESVALKQISNIRLPIINWQLENFASSILVEVEEVDLTETIVTTNTRTVKFATNFEINPTFGLLEKVGLKFGASLEQTNTQTTQRTVTLGNDVLGQAIVNFADDVVLSEIDIPLISNNIFITREYSTGFCSFSVEPLRVQ